MFIGFSWVKRRALALVAIGVLGGACSAVPHDCYETRSCPESEPVVSGSKHDGGSAGAAGRSERGHAGAGRAGASSVASAGSGEADAGAPAAAEAPSVLSVSPSDGARRVASDARIVLTFSQPMDTAATEAAYESVDLPASALSFSWDETTTTLTLTPHSPLSYVRAGKSEGGAALAYHYGFNAHAADRLGQPLTPVQLTFSTLRQVSVELPVDGERTGNWTFGEDEGIHNCLRKPKAQYEPTVCIGDDVNNVRYIGFVSFDLSELPEDIAQFQEARLLAEGVVHGVPAQLGESQIEHVAYVELGESALTAAPLSSANPLFVAATLTDDAQLALDLDVTAGVADDYENRAARAARTQYRLAFAKVLANDHWDDVEAPTRTIHLALSYLLP